MQLSKWVRVTRSASMVILFHEGSGQMLVFRAEAAQDIELLKSGGETGDVDTTDIDEELVANLSRYEFLD